MAVTVTGASYLSTTSVPASLNQNSANFTASVWVYITSYGGSTVTDFNQAGGTLVVAGDPNGSSRYPDYIGPTVWSDDQTQYFELSVGDFTQELYVAGTTLALNTWHHVAMVFNGTSTTGYINGTSYTSGGGSLPSTAIAWKRIIVGGFNGRVSDAVLYNRALNSTEIGQLRTGNWGAVSATGLVGRWPLYEGTSTADVSGNGRTLTATGTVTDVAGTPGASGAMASAGVGTLSVNSGSTAISGAGGTASAASGTLTAYTLNATGAIASAGTASLTVASSRAAAGGVASAATASPVWLVSATGGSASAASGTLSTGSQTAISASGAVASAGTAAPVWAVTATGGSASAASGSLVRAIAATGAQASAGTLDLYQAGGLPSRFQGTQSFTRTVSIAGTQVHTLTCWVRATTTTSVDANCVQLTNSTGTDTDSSRIGVVDNSGTFSAVFVQHRTGIGSTAVLPAMSGSQWHHLALVVDGTNQVSYIDGTQVDSRAFDPSLRSTGFTTIAIGQNFGGATPDNAIQDVQVYTSALSAADIKTVIRGLIPAGSTLYARWMVQTGAPLQDISGNARVLTQVGTWAGASFAPLYGPGGNSASAASGTVGSGAIALTATGAQASAATGALLWSTPATGGSASAGTAALTVAASLTASGAVSSAASAGTGLLITGTGGTASAATGTASEAVALAAAGSGASAAGAAPSIGLLITATGAVSSAATATAAVSAAIGGTGAIASAATASTGGTTNIAATGGQASAATGGLAAAVAISAAGGSASAATAGTGLLLAGTGASASAGTGTATEAVAIAASGGIASAAVLSISGALQASGGVASASSGVVSVRLAIAATGGQASAAGGTATAAAALAAAGGIASAATNVIPLRSVTASGGIASAATGNGVWGSTLVASGALRIAAAGVLAVGVALGASGASASSASGTLTAVNPNAPILSGWADGGDVADAAPHGAWVSDTVSDTSDTPHGTWCEDPVTGGVVLHPELAFPLSGSGSIGSASSATLTMTSLQPTLAGTIGGGTFTLQKNWVFGTNGNLGNAAALNAEFTYHDAFNTISNGSNYGALTQRAAGSPTFGVWNWADVGMADDQQPEDTSGRYRTFQSDSMLAHVKPLNTGSTVVGPASTHNAGCGSLMAQYQLSAGGSRLGQTVVWETRCRIVAAPDGYWFALWIVGPDWDGGPELDVVEAFSSTSPNVNGDLFNSNAIGGTNAQNYFAGGWDSVVSTLGYPGYALPSGAQSLRNWHTFTLAYKPDNTFTCWMDSTVIQSGTLDWKVPTSSTVPVLRFLFDFGFGHTAISPINAAVISDINATPLTYEIAYSRIWLR